MSSKVKYHLVSREDLELFEKAVEYRTFFEEVIMDYCRNNCDTLHERSWYKALYDMKMYMSAQEPDNTALFELSEASFHDMYDQAWHAIQTFQSRGKLSKASRKALEKISLVSWPCHRGYMTLIAKKAGELIDKQRQEKAEQAAISEKTVEKQPEIEKEIKVPFYKRTILQPCGWALLVAAIFLYVMKVH